MSDPEIFEMPLDDDSATVGIELPIAPHGVASCFAVDTSDASRQLLTRINLWWPHLWPAMLNYIEVMSPELDLEVPLAGEVVISASVLEAGYFMADKCDTYLSLECDEEAPSWDFFLNNGEILHSQPVF